MTIQDLVAWAQENGALVSSHVQFKQIDVDNVGAFFTEAGEDADELAGNHIRLPLKLVLTRDEAVKSFSGDFSSVKNTNSLLKLYLARERTSSFIGKSFFAPYLQLLPSLTAISSPYTWNAADKALLSGTNLGSSLRANLTQIIEEWWTIINVLGQDDSVPQDHYINMKFYYEHKFYTDDDLYKYFSESDVDNWTSFANYLWASLIFKSRSFPAYLLKDDLKREVKQDEAMLLPLVDLLNHNPSSKVNWTASGNSFDFRAETPVEGQLYNNYGMKGNEELLLAYGFCLENNASDSAALKIKIPDLLLEEVKQKGLQLPKISDYTTSVVETGDTKEETDYKDGVLFFITQNHVPSSLIELFQYLVRTDGETNITLRSQFAGLNQLRSAIESKASLLKPALSASGSSNARNVAIYVESQRKIFLAAIKTLKRKEKEMLAEHKTALTSLKSVYKKDIKFQLSLLVSLGITSYDQLVEAEFQDQCWLLYLMRCANRDEYEDKDVIPQWIHDQFVKMSAESISAGEVVQYQEIYQSLIPPLATAVPEIYGVGKWRVEEMILAARLLDRISFVRGKEQECILVGSHQ